MNEIDLDKLERQLKHETLTRGVVGLVTMHVYPSHLRALIAAARERDELRAQNAILTAGLKKAHFAEVKLIVERDGARDKALTEAAAVADKYGWSQDAGERVSSYGEGALDIADAIASMIRRLKLKDTEHAIRSAD